MIFCMAGKSAGTITPKIADPTLTGLSYQTDNGAQYCFCNEDCDSKLLAVSAHLKQQQVRNTPVYNMRAFHEINIFLWMLVWQVPVQLMSFQGGWWTNPNIHTRFCAPWCAPPNLNMIQLRTHCILSYVNNARNMHFWICK
eukprot:COSAG05_NODE_1534_length_4616_cov_6.656409_7_plen_141_part_00